MREVCVKGDVCACLRAASMRTVDVTTSKISQDVFLEQKRRKVRVCKGGMRTCVTDECDQCVRAWVCG